jgi:hypothetical protein
VACEYCHQICISDYQLGVRRSHAAFPPAKEWCKTCKGSALEWFRKVDDGNTLLRALGDGSHPSDKDTTKHGLNRVVFPRPLSFTDFGHRAASSKDCALDFVTGLTERRSGDRFLDRLGIILRTLALWSLDLRNMAVQRYVQRSAPPIPRRVTLA